MPRGHSFYHQQLAHLENDTIRVNRERDRHAKSYLSYRHLLNNKEEEEEEEKMMLSMPRSMALMATLCVWLVFMATWVEPFSVADKLTAYQVLQGYDFPIGILPKGVTGYELDSSTGKFSAYLNGTCSFSLEGSYQLKYKSTIKGYISKDRLRDLSGVTVKVLFFWLNIVEVVRSGDELQFSVGIASADFAISNFAECPQCGCGLDCLTLNLTESLQVRSGRPFVSST